MRVLSAERFERAKQFVHKKGRALDRAWFAYHFENGTEEAVLNELAKYQNPDGGFGNKLEPDFFLDESSPMATTVGFQYLAAMGIPADHPIVQKGIAYLVKTYNRDRGRWTSVPQSVNDVPHAPWWHFNGKRGHTSEDWGNPAAEITGYFRLYNRLVPEELVQSLSERCIQHFEDLATFEIHEVLCYVRLSNHLEPADRNKIVEKVKRHIFEIVDVDAEKWLGYGLQPLGLVDSPESPFYERLSRPVEENLDFLIEQQTEEGYWEPNWSWGQYEDDWLKAKEWWKSRITVDNLMTLKRFGRLGSRATK